MTSEEIEELRQFGACHGSEFPVTSELILKACSELRPRDEGQPKYDGQSIVDSLPAPETPEEVGMLGSALTFATIYGISKHTQQIADLPQEKFDTFISRVQTKWKQALIMIMGMEVGRVTQEGN